jgi:hypothetical protein
MTSAPSNPDVVDYSTNAPNQAYLIGFTTIHSVKRDGWIKLIIPPDFTMTSTSSAVALFQVVNDDGVNHALVNSFVSTDEEGSITGQITLKLEANTQYTIRVGGLRNPRFLVDNAQLSDND